MSSKTENMTAGSSLISRCKDGDNIAYRELYNLYVKAMFNISVRILNNRDEAEDVLQEAFLKAFQNIKKFDKETAFAGWLKRIVINQSIDVIRKQKERLISLEETEDIKQEEEEADEDIIYDIKSVREAIQKLPDGYRIVLTLYLFEDYSHKDIAGTLNISEGTSKSQYNRAKKKLIQIIHQKNNKS